MATILLEVDIASLEINYAIVRFESTKAKDDRIVRGDKIYNVIFTYGSTHTSLEGCLIHDGINGTMCLVITSSSIEAIFFMTC